MLSLSINKKNIILSFLISVLISFTFITNFNATCKHDWTKATCVKASFCRNCGEISGEALPHKFKEMPDGSKKCEYCRLVDDSNVKPECVYCKKYFNSENELNNHLSTHHTDVEIITYNTNSGYWYEEYFLCCNTKFYSSVDFYNHLGTVHDIHACKYCKLKLSSAEELQNHINGHDAETIAAYREIAGKWKGNITETQSYQCPVCKKKFINQKSADTCAKNHSNNSQRTELEKNNETEKDINISDISGVLYQTFYKVLDFQEILLKNNILKQKIYLTINL